MLPAAVQAVPGLVVPAGGVTVAELTRVPVADALMFAVTVNVAVPFTSRLTVVLMLPVPLAAVQLEPADADAGPRRRGDRRRERIRHRRQATGLGPLLVTVIVYVVVVRHVTTVSPSVFTIDRSATVLAYRCRCWCNCRSAAL